MIKVDWLTATKLIKEKKLGILPTNSLYGFSASILFPETMERIYRAKNRMSSEQLVILAASIEQIRANFPVIITKEHIEIATTSTIPTSIIFKIDNARSNEWDHPLYKKGEFAIRIPKDLPELMELLKQTGPITSTSVNKKGEPPEVDPMEIHQKFSDQIDFIVDIGKLENNASRIIEVKESGTQEILR